MFTPTYILLFIYSFYNYHATIFPTDENNYLQLHNNYNAIYLTHPEDDSRQEIFVHAMSPNIV